MWIRNRVRRLVEAPRERRLGVSTAGPSWTTPSDYARLRNHRYESTPYRLLDAVAEHLPLGPDDRLCDLGCGLGRVGCYFATRPMRGCLAVDIDPDLVEGARQNAARMIGRESPIEAIVADATEVDYSEVTVVVMYNPFHADVLRMVLARLVDGPARNLPLRSPISIPFTPLCSMISRPCRSSTAFTYRAPACRTGGRGCGAAPT